MWNSFWTSLDAKSKGRKDFSSPQQSQSYISHVRQLSKVPLPSAGRNRQLQRTSLHCQRRDILSLWKGLKVEPCDTGFANTTCSPSTSLAHSPAGLFPLGAFTPFYLAKKEVSRLHTLFPCPGQLAGRAVLGPMFGWAHSAAPAGMQRFLC